jgi:hypothetical protein
VSLTLSEYGEAKDLPLDFLAEIGVRQEETPRGPRIIISYYGEDGNEIATRYRHSLSGKCFSWPQGSETALYGLDELKSAREAGFVVLVEGESDCHTLWLSGFPAIGIPGAPGGWNEERDALLFEGIPTVYLVNEKDKAAKSLLAKLKASAIRDRVRVVSLVGAKDPSELYCDDPGAFHDRFAAALREADLETAPNLCARAARLEEGDAQGARLLINEGARLSLDVIDADELIDAIHASTKLTKAVLKVAWKRAEKLAQKDAASEALRRAIEEAQANAAREQAEKEALRKQRAKRVAPFAKDPKLFTRVVAIAHRLGVVREDVAIKATYLTVTSRLLIRRVISLLRRGTAASGKNYLFDQVLVLKSWSRSFEQDSAKAKWIAARVGPLQFRARGVTEGGRRSPTGDTSCARRKIHAAAARGDGVK